MLDVQDIYFSYKNNPVLKGVTFDSIKGKFIGVLGPNGTGKSTLFKNILTLLKPSHGNVIVEGKNLSKISSYERARLVAYVPQFMEIIFPITVFDFIMMGSKIKSSDTNQAKEITSNIIEKFDLEKLAFKDMKKISGGQRQRAFIARAFAQSPRLIILDEPTSNLDFKYKNTTLSLIKEIGRQRGHIILIAIHDLDIASKYCDSFIVLKDGKILIKGNSSDVYKKDIIQDLYGCNVDILDYRDQKLVVFA